MRLELTLFPARDGDCLLLTWAATDGAGHALLVDLGRRSTYESIRDQLGALAALELLVVSHVDADHIEGALPMIQEAAPPLRPRRVWFNGYRSIRAAATRRDASLESYGPRQGDLLTRGLARHGWDCNAEFASRIVSTDSPEACDGLALPEGMTVRLLAPDDRALEALLPAWAREVERAKRAAETAEEGGAYEIFDMLDVRALASKPYAPDTSAANGSSIALLIEFAGKRVLLAADTPAEALEAAVARLLGDAGGRLRLDLMKISHHGSRANTSTRLLAMLDCTNFAFSTDGSHRHAHPHRETIARILCADPKRSKRLYFNYRQPQTVLWEAAHLQRAWNYECVFPASQASNGTLTIVL